MPKISLCCPTYRLGSLDVLLESARRQSFQDFEVVLIDALWSRRKDLVHDRFQDAGIRIVHAEPDNNQFPVDQVATARNTALRLASGELLVWIVDYSWLPRDLLAAHWRTWELSGHRACLAAPHVYVWPPAFRGGVPWWAPMARMLPNQTEGVTYADDNDAARGYAQEVLAGTWDDWLWSVFDPSVGPEDWDALRDDLLFSVRQLTVPTLVDGRMVLRAGGPTPPGTVVPSDVKWQIPETLTNMPLSGETYHLKNESSPRELSRTIGGFGEQYDGAHCFDDIDFGIRMERAGLILRFGHIPLTIINSRHYFPPSVRTRTVQDNFALYEKVRG